MNTSSRAPRAVWVLMVIALIAVGCSGTDGPGTAQADDRGILRVAHELSWGGGELLDPTSASPLDWATALVFDGLVSAGPNGEVVPALAHEWTANTDATEWTFSLVDDVRFHDGTMFGSEDVKFTFERLRSSDSPLAGTLSALERVEAVDDRTAVFHFSEASVDFALLMTDRRMRVLSADSTDPVGTGPFVVQDFDPINTVILTAFDDYWRGRPGLAGVEIVAMPDAASRVAAIESGRLHLLDSIGLGDVENLLGRREFRIHQVPSGDWRGITFDTRIAPYNDARVRSALKLVVDRAEMIELVAGGELGAEISCDSPVWSSDPYYRASTCDQDLDRARELLAEAGYPDGLDITISTAPLFSDWLPMVEVFQYQAAQAGIRVEIVVEDSVGYWSDVWMNEPAVTTSWTQRTAEQVIAEAFVSTAQWNEAFWVNADFDQAIHAAAVEPDLERRIDLYQQAQQLIQEDSGTIIPYHVKRSRVLSADVTGVPDGIGRYEVPWHQVAIGESAPSR